MHVTLPRLHQLLTSDSPQMATCCHLNCKCTLLHANTNAAVCPILHPPTTLRFSIKIQTEIEDLKGSAPYLAGLCHRSRRIGGGELLSGHELRALLPHWGVTHLNKASSSILVHVMIPPSRGGRVLD